MPKGSLMSGFEKPLRGRRLCPRRRTVDRAAVGNVKMWNCGSVKVWKYENGLGLLSIACCDDACGEYSCQFNGFSDKGIQLAMFNVVAFNDDLEPHSCLGEFFHRKSEMPNPVGGVGKVAQAHCFFRISTCPRPSMSQRGIR